MKYCVALSCYLLLRTTLYSSCMCPLLNLYGCERDSGEEIEIFLVLETSCYSVEMTQSSVR